MTTWHRPLIISLLLHGIVFSIIMTVKTPVLVAVETPPIKAYIVSMPPPNPLPVIETPSIQREEATLPKKIENPIIPAENTIIKIKKQVKPLKPAAPKALEDTNSYKKIDLKLGLKSILKKQQNTFPSTFQQSQNSAQPQRLTVPKEHQIANIDPLKIEKQSMQFTTYRFGDKCFKKVSIGAGVMPKNDLPDSYFMSITCATTKITDAYDKAMNKWLEKK
ncbi:hypothetical protein [Pseudoalteromonas porphyrae]|uniref:Uncharacterized protein n=1 Tax=Pseudoalteromonas porphyrae TaxID=187330 RepID=A0A0N1EWK4_9GAMM|nr:hypothetical protein [Pseudoalteromonas porphyrae]KPH64634.1 hypothetical protein ADS77_05000 [Pseudoalteromonas porphyrae]